MFDWSSEKVKNLPRISYDYVFPYLNEIKRHPEIYEQKALFMDLVATGLNNNLNISDDAKLFIREQLIKNGTMEAIKNGTFNEFIADEAQKEGYKPYRITPEKSENIANSLSGLRTRDEQFAQYFQQSDYFDEKLVFFCLQDPQKTDMIIDQYKRFREKQQSKGKNVWTDCSNFQNNMARYELMNLSQSALQAGNTKFALEILRDMAENSQPETSIKTNNAKVDFLSHIKDIEQQIHKNGIEKEVAQIVEKYKDRPEVKFHLNANPLAKARKKLAQKIDARLGTNLEAVKLRKLDKMVESTVAKVLFRKHKEKDNQ